MQSFESRKTLKDLGIISVVTILLTLLIWIPHYFVIPNFYFLNFQNGFDTIYRNFDGIEYITISKSLYFPEKLKDIPQSLEASYYAAHFPGFSILILLLSPLFGALKSMLIISILFTVFSAIAFYFLIKDFRITNQPLYLSLIFLVLPARWLIVHSVGSAEPMFIFFVICSVYFFLKFEQLTNSHIKYQYIYLAAIFASLSQLTRPPGILLFISFTLYIIWKYFYRAPAREYLNILLLTIKRYSPLLLSPLMLLAIFYWFHISFNDFFAYFHSGDNIHLVFPPFRVFNKYEPWVGDIWLEDIIFILLLSYFSIALLFKQKHYPLAFFVLVYTLATSFVAHRDISRYILPVFPFVLIAFEKALVSKEFKIALLIILPAIYLYAQNFLIQNTAPYPNVLSFD